METKNLDVIIKNSQLVMTAHNTFMSYLSLVLKRFSLQGIHRQFVDVVIADMEDYLKNLSSVLRNDDGVEAARDAMFVSAASAVSVRKIIDGYPSDDSTISSLKDTASKLVRLVEMACDEVGAGLN